jgi:hypothetical protein
LQAGASRRHAGAFRRNPGLSRRDNDIERLLCNYYTKPHDTKGKFDEKVYVVSDSANMWKEKDEQDITRFIVICEKQNAIGELCFHHSTQKWEVVRLESLDE